ncbi:MAG TPA: winged helix-turn-helix domain-containing protein [Polyangiales bacterium]|nr:winged helix-turn-helix domain-containing protein [Polyangiales bacterium]
MKQFGEFELDEPSRTLVLKGRALALQPKVFDLLAYLLAHAGRVVSKQELMEHLWPDVHVSEGSLQRAVSLLRRALREGDLEHALKSFSGHGYRFALDRPVLAPLLPASQREEARAAAAARDWARVVELLAACTELGVEDYELWALAYECLGQPGDATPYLRTAVERHEAAGAREAASRCATTLSKIHLERSESALARGWLARAASLLEERPGDALAYLRWMEARFAAFEGRAQVALERAEQAHASAGSVPLRALTLGYVGFFNISLGRTRLGLEQQDHAAALAMSSAVDPITGGLIYCNILWSCRCFADWSRGHQWSDGFETWCKANYAGTTASCDLHRAEVLGARATLPEALHAIEVALAKLPTSDAWALGDAHRVRGDLRAAIGDLDGAREDYRSAYAIGWDGEPGNAVLLAAAGDLEGALSALDRVLASASWFGLQRRAWILAHKARICARAGRVEQAEASIEQLTSCFDGWPSSAIHAIVTEAQAALAQGEPSPIQLLTLARQLWTSIGVEHHAARVRLELAQRLLAKGDRSGASIELACAAESAKRVGAGALENAIARLSASV